MLQLQKSALPPLGYSTLPVVCILGPRSDGPSGYTNILLVDIQPVLYQSPYNILRIEVVNYFTSIPSDNLEVRTLEVACATSNSEKLG